MANRVTFEMDAKTEAAVRGMLNLVRAQETTEKAFGRSTAAAKTHTDTLATVSKHALKFTTLLIGTSSVAGAFSKVEAEAAASTERLIGFGREMTSLLSLGSNLGNFGRIRAEVAGLSTALGLTTQQIADARFAIESGAPNLSKGIQKALSDAAGLTTKATGAELADTVRLVTKTFQGFGKSVGDVTPIAAKLFRTAELGDTTMQQLAERFPEIAAAARVSGRQMEEAMAAVSLATQRGGDVEKDMTATRNVLLEMMKAIDDGLLKSTGSLIGDLETIGRSPDLFKKIFEKRTIGTAEVLVKNVRDLRDLLGQIGATPDGILTAKLFGQFKDPTKAFETRMGIIEQARNNRAAFSGPGALNQYSEDIELRKLGIRASLPTGTKFMAGGPARLGQLLDDPSQLLAGIEEIKRQVAASGDAQALKIFEALFGARSKQLEARRDYNQIARPNYEDQRRRDNALTGAAGSAAAASGTGTDPAAGRAAAGLAARTLAGEAQAGPPIGHGGGLFGVYTPPKTPPQPRLPIGRAPGAGDAALIANLPGIYGMQDPNQPLGNNPFLAAAQAQRTAAEASAAGLTKLASAATKSAAALEAQAAKLEKLAADKALGIDQLPAAERDRILAAAGGNPDIVASIMAGRSGLLDQQAGFDLNGDAIKTLNRTRARDRQRDRQRRADESPYGGYIDLRGPVGLYPHGRNKPSDLLNYQTDGYPPIDYEAYRRRQAITARRPNPAVHGSRAHLAMMNQGPASQSPLFTVNALNVMPGADQVRLFNIFNGGSPF